MPANRLTHPREGQSNTPACLVVFMVFHAVNGSGIVVYPALRRRAIPSLNFRR